MSLKKLGLISSIPLSFCLKSGLNLNLLNRSPVHSSSSDPRSTAAKLPRPVLEQVFAFPPNRETLGGTAYLIQQAEGNILVDCPAWDETHQTFLEESGGVRWLVITHRDAIARAHLIQQRFNCEILIQEQEAYLLPGTPVTPFQSDYLLIPHCQVIWTPGYSPGSSCLYCDRHNGILFTGRHLLPNQHGQPVPLKLPKTFHWLRQLNNVRLLRDRFSPETLHYICPGANTGFLRGNRYIDQAYTHLTQIDLNSGMVVSAVEPL